MNKKGHYSADLASRSASSNFQPFSSWERYITVLLSNVGESIDVFNSMDGRTLMPYQCVVRREQWMALRRLRACWVQCSIL